MGDATSETGGGQPELKDKAQEVGQNLRDLGGQVRDVAREKYEQVSGQAREKYEQVAGQARDYYEQGRDQAQQWEQTLESYVQEKPIQALLIAAGVGVLLGVLWKRS
jgi:ElaB/YqjD/DUF883 family membrane-anchored ribosome-binding protein